MPGINSLNQCPDIVWNSAFENDSDPSLGQGGLYPGNHTRTVVVNNISHDYYLYVPQGYQPSEAVALMAVWHGQTLPGQSAVAAQNIRDFWMQTAENNRFIVIAQASTGPSGGWLPSNDAITLASIIADVQGAYNIENTRIYGWGFSAGGHVMHAIALNNTDFFAGYGVSAGKLSTVAGTSILPTVPRSIAAFISVGSQDPMLADVQSDSALFIQSGWVINNNHWLDIFQGGHILQQSLPDTLWNVLCTATVLD